MVFKLWYWKWAIFQRCIRVGCGRPSIRNAEWEDEYCRFCLFFKWNCLLASLTNKWNCLGIIIFPSNQCVVLHCDRVFKDWVKGQDQGGIACWSWPKCACEGRGLGGDSQWIGSELDREQTSWCKREGSLFKRKGDKLCARDKKPKQSATQPEGVWFCVRFHWKLSSASQEYEVARKMKWNGLLSFFRQPEKIKFSWILCNQMRCICETCFYLVD